MPIFPLWIRVVAFVLSVLSAVIGFGGTRDDLRGWKRLLAVLPSEAAWALCVVFAAVSVVTDPRAVHWFRERRTRPALDLQGLRLPSAQMPASASEPVRKPESQKPLAAAPKQAELDAQIRAILKSLQPSLLRTVRWLVSGEPTRVSLSEIDRNVLVRDLKYIRIITWMANGEKVAILRADVARVARDYFIHADAAAREKAVRELSKSEQEFLQLLCRRADEFGDGLEHPPLMEHRLYLAARSLTQNNLATIVSLTTVKQRFALNPLVHDMVAQKIGCELQRTEMVLFLSQIKASGASGSGAGPPIPVWRPGGGS